MTYDQYWNGDVDIARAYYEADKRARQRKSEEMWLMGVYAYNAVATAVGNALRKKGTKPQNYMESAIRVIPYTAEEREAIALKERQKTIEYFNRMAQMWNAEGGR